MYSSLITLSRPSLTSRIKIANGSLYCTALVLWNSLTSGLRHDEQRDVTYTPSPKLNSLSLIFQTLFFLKS